MSLDKEIAGLSGFICSSTFSGFASILLHQRYMLEHLLLLSQQRAQLERSGLSGFDGPWTKEPSKFDNSFFVVLNSYFSVTSFGSCGILILCGNQAISVPC